MRAIGIHQFQRVFLEDGPKVPIAINHIKPRGYCLYQNVYTLKNVYTS